LFQKVGELAEIAVRHVADVADSDSSETFQGVGDCGRILLVWSINGTIGNEWLLFLGVHWEERE
jgi:hypothetical protein